MSLDVVCGAIARPPSGFALEQLKRAEQVIEIAREREYREHGKGCRCRLASALDLLDKSVSPSKERESSDVSVVRS